ncbi:hypothetical protein dsx2_3144 [Desulfovibrio sp. X2]|uniref:anti-sigma factor family protein n=1 Tax=Desulfovibrio sp. X2 TaxID=941449 RepID=UPI000358C76F|nr:zf-HC2 domain-containing protein [Desulfovibrio sp. X2]EPR41625.1 hypothetical protein dsx2_3144 [Desulfovibrio sp. X2]
MRLLRKRAEPKGCLNLDEMSAYLDGLLPRKLRNELEDHLAFCSACRRTVIDLRAILTSPDNEPVPECAEGLGDACAARLRLHSLADLATSA